jgi:amidophosphoribosyltransferase
MFDKFKEECGVFGIINNSKAKELTNLALHSLQHRGQEASGIAFEDANKEIKCLKHYGLALQGLNDLVASDADKTSIAIGHVRYSTSGSKSFTDIQPFTAKIKGADIALAHNGNLINADEVRSELLKQGAVFNTNIDSEVFLHLIARSKFDEIEDKIKDACSIIKGAYSIVIIYQGKLIAFRDPNGIRPLSIGMIECQGQTSYVVASETCAFDITGAKFVRNIEVGELVVVSVVNGNCVIASCLICNNNQIKRRFCVFEYIYFARPDSILEGNSVYEVRKAFGKILAKRMQPLLLQIKPDVVVPVPDSGVPSALGFSLESGISFDLGLIRSHYSGRSFIAPSQDMREFKVKTKHNVNVHIVKDKKVVLVDDSIVRGTTSKQIIKMVREAGAKEVHLVISSPPTIHPCFYGIDTPNAGELIANKFDSNIQQIASYLEVDSLTYLSLDDVYEVIKTHTKDQFCDMCFTKNRVINN